MSKAYKPAEGVLFKGAENFPKLYYDKDRYEKRIIEADEEKEEYLKRIEPDCVKTISSQ